MFFFGYWAIFLLGNAAAVLANRDRVHDGDGDGDGDGRAKPKAQ